MSELIKCSNLSIGYQGKTVASNINFSISSGDYLCIVGANGAGKSTLMKTILGLLKPLDGTIEYLNGLEKTSIGYLPQATEVQKDFPSSVYEVVLSGCLNKLGRRLFYSKKEKNIAKQNIDKLGLLKMKEKSYRELSGGQQQRVLLARALCATEKVLLLDEPVTGLDPEITKELYDLIDKLNHEDGLTILMITHDVKQSISHASHVLSLDKDSFFGTREEYVRLIKEDDSNGYIL